MLLREKERKVLETLCLNADLNAACACKSVQR